MKRLLLKMLICVAIVIFTTHISYNHSFAQSGWQFQEYKDGWYVLAEPGNLSRNDGWWYKWRANGYGGYGGYNSGYNSGYYRVYQFGNSYAVTKTEITVVDKLSSGIAEFEKQKQRLEQLLQLNKIEQERLKALAETAGYDSETGDAYSSSKSSYTRKNYYNQRGSTVYGYFPSFKQSKDIYSDLQIGAELNRIADAAREQRDSGNEATRNLIQAFNNAVDRYVEIKTIEGGVYAEVFGKSAGSDDERHVYTEETQETEQKSYGQKNPEPSVQPGPGPKRGNGDILRKPPPIPDGAKQNGRNGRSGNGSAEFRIRRAFETVQQRCVRCHDGTSNSKNQTLNLADFENLDAAWMESILERIVTGDTKLKMPQGGPYLDQELVGDFYILSGLCKKK